MRQRTPRDWQHHLLAWMLLGLSAVTLGRLLAQLMVGGAW